MPVRSMLLPGLLVAAIAGLPGAKTGHAQEPPPPPLSAPLGAVQPAPLPPIVTRDLILQDIPLPGQPPAAADGPSFAQPPIPTPAPPFPGPPPAAAPIAPAAAFYPIAAADQALLEELAAQLAGLQARLDARWDAYRAEFAPDRAASALVAALEAGDLPPTGAAHPGILPMPSLELVTAAVPRVPEADFVASARDDVANLQQSMAGAYGSWRAQIAAYAGNLDFRARSLMLLRGEAEEVARQLRAGEPVSLSEAVRAELRAETAMLEDQFVPFAAHLELVEAELMAVYARHWAHAVDLSQRGARVWTAIRALHGGLAPDYQAIPREDGDALNAFIREYEARYRPLGERLAELHGCILEIEQSALLPMRMTAGFPGLATRFLAPSFPQASIPDIPQVLTDVLPVPVAATPCHAQRLAGEIPQERPGFDHAEGLRDGPRLASAVDEPEILEADPLEADPLASEIGDPPPEPPFPEEPPAIVEGPPTPEELPERILACRVNADGVVAYPRLTDALLPAEREASRHEPPVAGDGVALHDGSFTHEAEDLEIAGPGMAMRIARSYRSSVAYAQGGLVGQGWSLNLDRRILPQPARGDEDRLLDMEDLDRAQPVLFQDGSGRSDRHPALIGGPATGWRTVVNWGQSFRAHVTTYVSPPGAFWEIQRYLVVDAADHPFGGHRNIDAAGGESLFYVLRDKDGAQQVFNCRGQLVLLLDRHDNRITLEYGGQPNPLTQNPVLVRARDTAGRAYDFQSVEIGRAQVATHWLGQPLRIPDAPILRLGGFTDFAGRAVRYGFAGGEAEPRLAEVVGEPGRGASFVTRYGYDGEGRLASLTAPRQSELGGQPWLTVTYDGRGRVVVQEQAGAATLFDWSDGGAAEQLPDATVRNYGLVDTGAGWAVDRVEVIDPDDNGGPWTSRFAFNGFGQLSEAVLPRGNRTRYRHETENGPVTAGPVRNDGSVTYLNNLAAGNLLAIEREPAGVGEGPPLVQAWRYEPLYNEIAEETDAAGNPVLLRRFEYHGYGPQRGRNGNPVAIEIPRITRPGGADPLGPLAIRFDYDPRGLKLLEVDQIGGESRYGYDALGYPASMRRPDGSEIRFTHDTRGNMTERHGPGDRRVRIDYDLRDLPLRRIDDPDGFANTVRFGFDANRNLVRMETDWKDNFGPGPGRPAGQPFRRMSVEHVYDLGNRRTETRELLEGEVLRVTRMRHDGRGRLVAVTTPSPAGSGTVTRLYQHDARGLVRAETMAAGTPEARTLRYEHDANGNLVAEWNAAGTRVRERRYDGFDRLRSVTDALGTVTRFRRDRNGNPLEIEVEGATGQGDRTAVLSRVERRYDELNRVIEQTYWADPARRAGPAREYWFYDGRGQLEAQERPNGTTVRYSHDALGRPVLAVQPDGNTTRNSYDLAGDLVAVEETVRERQPGPFGAGERRSYRTQFTYDALGRMASRTADGRVRRLWYDSLNRLRGEAADGSGGHEARYDGLGRRIFVRDGRTVLDFDWNDAGLVTAIRPGQGPMERTSYDSLGQIRTLTVERGPGDRLEQDLVHDSAGRLVEVREPGGIVQAMTYDAMGQALEQSYRSGGDTLLVRRFGYDGLGRMAWGEAGLTSFRREHDGLGNLVREEQVFRNDAYTIASRHAEDLSQRVLDYPQTGGRPLTATWHYDEMGRVDRVEANRREVAGYAYVGADRVQRRALANGVTGYRVYGPDRALTGIEVWHDGRERWLARADASGGQVTAWLNEPGARGAVTSQSVSIRTDIQGRVAETETRSILPPASPNEISLPFLGFSFHDYDDSGRLAAIHNVALDDRSVHTQASQSRFSYDDRGRVSRVETRMAERDRMLGTDRPPFANWLGPLARTGDLVSGWSYQEVQDFDYDARDRLVRDGRFDYGFDPDGRLTQVHDRWAARQRLPLRELDLHYDAIGRLVAIENLPAGSADSLRLLHDDNLVIAELAYGMETGRYAGRGVLAYYLHGARPGELVRMDRRRGDAIDAEFETWYPQEDLDGRIAFVTSPAGEFREIAMQDHPWMTRVPRIEGTATTMPYLGNGTRHLLHPDAPLNEAAGQLAYNYRSTPEIRFRQDLDRFSRRVYDQAWDMQAAGAIVMAAPLLPVHGGALAAQAYLSLGVNWGLAGLTGRDYSPNRALLDFGLGGIGGYFAGAAAARLPVSAGAAAGLDYAADTALNTLVDVIAEGEGLMTALAQNAIGIAAGRSAIHVVGQVLRTPMPNRPLRRIVDGPPPARASTDAAAPARRPTMVLEESPVPRPRAEETFNQAAYEDFLRRLESGELGDPDGYALFRGLTAELESLARGSDAYLGRWARRALRDIDQGHLKFRPMDDNLRLEYPVGGERVNNGVAFGPLNWNPRMEINGVYTPNINMIRLNPLVNGSHRATPRDLVATFLHEFAHSKGANEFESWYIELRTLYRTNPAGSPNLWLARRFGEVLLEEGRVPARWGPRLQYFITDFQGYRQMPNAQPWLWEAAFRTGVSPF